MPWKITAYKVSPVSTSLKLDIDADDAIYFDTNILHGNITPGTIAIGTKEGDQRVFCWIGIGHSKH